MKSQAKLVTSDLKKQCDTVAGLLKMLSHPQRLVILCCLAEGEKAVGELEQACGISQSATSQFLKAMRLEGIIDSRREGHFVYYKITDNRIFELMKALHKTFCR